MCVCVCVFVCVFVCVCVCGWGRGASCIVMKAKEPPRDASVQGCLAMGGYVGVPVLGGLPMASGLIFNAMDVHVRLIYTH